MDLERVLAEEQLERDERFSIERCKIATTAESSEDDVYVTFPNGPAPQKQEIVDYWRIGIDDDGEARYPVRGATGIILTLDTGELWLIH